MRTFKIRQALAIVALASLSVTGCGKSQDAPETPVETPEVQTPTPEPMSAEERFMLDVEARGSSSLLSNPDQQLIEIGKAICHDLGTGIDFELYINSLVAGAEGQMSPSDIAVLTRSAVVSYCPVYEEDMEAYVRKYSPART